MSAATAVVKFENLVETMRSVAGELDNAWKFASEADKAFINARRENLNNALIAMVKGFGL